MIVSIPAAAVLVVLAQAPPGGAAMALQRGREFGLDRFPLPAIAAGQDEDGDVRRIDVGDRLRRQHRDAAHRADGRLRHADRFDRVAALSPEFGDRVRGLPVRVSVDDEQVDRFVGHLVSYGVTAEA